MLAFVPPLSAAGGGTLVDVETSSGTVIWNIMGFFLSLDRQLLVRSRYEV